MSKVHPLDKVFSAFSDYPFPADLKVLFLLLVVNLLLVSSPFLNTRPAQILGSMPILFFIPGYCLIAVLYPRDGDLSLPQRVILSFGFSVPIVLLVVLGLYFSPWAMQLETLNLLVAFISVVLIPAAHYRRAQVRLQDVYMPRFSEIPAAFRRAFAPLGGDRVDRLLSGVLVLVLVITLSTTILVIALPKENEHFTDFFILGAGRMAYDYPSEIITGQPYPVFIGVGNHEKRNATYLVEIWDMNTTFDFSTNSTLILSMDPENQFTLSLADNETTTVPYDLLVKKTGYNRVAFLLFDGTSPGPGVTGTNRINASYRDLYLRVSVQDAFYPVEDDGGVDGVAEVPA